MVSYAQRIVPVRTGFLRSSINYEVSGLTLWLRADARYAVYVEFGTRRMAARPYVRPTIDYYRSVIAAKLQQAVLNSFGI